MSENIGDSRKKDIITAAQRILAEGNSLNYDQVHEITLREVDAYVEDNFKVVTFIPIGGIIGIATHRKDEVIQDSDIVFVGPSVFSTWIYSSNSCYSYYPSKKWSDKITMTIITYGGLDPTLFIITSVILFVIVVNFILLWRKR